MTTIDLAFIKNFEAEVHVQYLTMGSKLRNTVWYEDNVLPNHVVEFRRHGDDRRVPCYLADYYAGDWVDQLDELRRNVNEQQVVAKAGAYALGRKSDELIVDAMTATLNRLTATRINGGVIFQARAMLGELGIPDDGQRFAIVGWRQWSELLNIADFADAPYVNQDELPWKGTQAKRWLDTLWVPHSGLPLDRSAKTRSCFWYHRTAVGHAIGAEVKTDITWHGDRAAHFVNNMMSQGACLIDPSRVVEMRCKEVR